MFRSGCMKKYLLTLCLLLTGLLPHVRAQLPTYYPQWWSDFNIIDLEEDHEENQGTANQGQAKYITLQAIEYLNEILEPVGGAGFVLTDLLNSNPATHNEPLNIGQLKNLSAPFFLRFQEVGFTPASPGWPATLILNEGAGDNSPLYPWLVDVTPDNYKNANIGQLKHLFSWSLNLWVLLDDDGDGMLDFWEKLIIDAGLTDQDSDGDVDIWDVLTTDDFDMDGLSNLDEFLNGTDPTKGDSDQDGRLDVDEILLGTDPKWRDHPDVELEVQIVQ